jgi:hypothetical protein
MLASSMHCSSLVVVSFFITFPALCSRLLFHVAGALSQPSFLSPLAFSLYSCRLSLCSCPFRFCTQLQLRAAVRFAACFCCCWLAIASISCAGALSPLPCPAAAFHVLDPAPWGPMCWPASRCRCPHVLASRLSLPSCALYLAVLFLRLACFLSCGPASMLGSVSCVVLA